MVGDATVDANKRPVWAVCNLLAPNDGYTTVDFSIVDNSLRSCRIAHTESENEADICHVAVIHAMSSRSDDIGRDQEAGTESADGLIPETLSSTQIARCTEVPGS